MSKRLVLSLLLGCCVVVAIFQTPPNDAAKSKNNPPPHIRRAVAPFSTVNSPEVRELVESRDRAIQAATTVLWANAQGHNIDEDAVERAAELLAEIRADDPEAIRALIANLDFELGMVMVTEDYPLLGLPAAKALGSIGGRRVIDALIRSLHAPKSEKEQVIIANILESCESPTIAAYRLELAIEDERAQKNADKDYIKQLEAVKYWVDNPAMLNDRRNWPYHL